MGESMRQSYDWSADVAKLKMPVMLVFGDADMVRPEHQVKFYQLLGGGLKDAGWNRESMPRNRLAILPDLTHYDIFASPRLAETVRPFLDGQSGAQELGRAGEGAGAEQVIDKEDVMLAGKEMVATIAVKDLATARKFYEGTLGLKVEDDKGTGGAHVPQRGHAPHRLSVPVRGDEPGDRAELHGRRRDRQPGEGAARTRRQVRALRHAGHEVGRRRDGRRSR